MVLYFVMLSDGSLLEELDDTPVVFRTKRAAQKYANMHYDDTAPGCKRPKVVSAVVKSFDKS